MVDLTKVVDLSGNDVNVGAIRINATAGILGVHVLDGNGTAPSSVTTTSSTYTVANMLAGAIVNSAATAVTATLDTAANIVKALNAAPYSGASVGDQIWFMLINGGSSTGAITVGAGTGGGFDTNVPAANKSVAINTSKAILIRLTNVTSGSEAYTIYM